MTKIYIYSDFITLGQFLKLANIISSGGEAKIYLLNNIITINNEIDNRRGRKLYPGDKLSIQDKNFEICAKN